jgi:hypothetical protein
LGRKKGIAPGGLAGPHRPDRLTGQLGRLAEFHGRNSFGFKFNVGYLPRLWKFAQGDLGEIWTWRFFLNSSRLLKGFQKNTIFHTMQCILGKINFGKDFYVQG